MASPLSSEHTGGAVLVANDRCDARVRAQVDATPAAQIGQALDDAVETAAHVPAAEGELDVGNDRERRRGGVRRRTDIGRVAVVELSQIRTAKVFGDRRRGSCPRRDAAACDAMPAVPPHRAVRRLRAGRTSPSRARRSVRPDAGSARSRPRRAARSAGSSSAAAGCSSRSRSGCRHRTRTSRAAPSGPARCVRPCARRRR